MQSITTTKTVDLGITSLITVLSGTKQVYSYEPAPLSKCSITIQITESIEK